MKQKSQARENAASVTDSERQYKMESSTTKCNAERQYRRWNPQKLAKSTCNVQRCTWYRNIVYKDCTYGDEARKCMVKKETITESKHYECAMNRGTYEDLKNRKCP